MGEFPKTIFPVSKNWNRTSEIFATIPLRGEAQDSLSNTKMCNFSAVAELPSKATETRRESEALTRLPGAEEWALPVTVVCDNIRDPGNLGTIIRCIAATGCRRLILTKGKDSGSEWMDVFCLARVSPSQILVNFPGNYRENWFTRCLLRYLGLAEKLKRRRLMTLVRRTQQSLNFLCRVRGSVGPESAAGWSRRSLPL